MASPASTSGRSGIPTRWHTRLRAFLLAAFFPTYHRAILIHISETLLVLLVGEIVESVLMLQLLCSGILGMSNVRDHQLTPVSATCGYAFRRSLLRFIMMKRSIIVMTMKKAIVRAHQRKTHRKAQYARQRQCGTTAHLWPETLEDR